jgi:tight adherence protein C
MDFATIGIVSFLGAATLGLVSLQSYLVERREVYRSLRAIRGIKLASNQVRQKELALPFLQRVMVPALRQAGRLGRKLSPAGATARLGRELAYAGSPAGWDAERVLAFKLLAAPVLAIVGFGATRLLPVGLFQGLIIAAILAGLGYYAPEWILRSRGDKRQAVLRAALPDALDLLSITVEAGLGFDAAVARVSRQSGGPLGEELHRVVQEMQIGKGRADALRDMGERSSVPELKSFVLAMVQADIFGISIARVLQVQAKEMRIKRRQRAEEKAGKIPVKIIMPLIFCIFPSLFVAVLGPAGITVYHAILGR